MRFFLLAIVICLLSNYFALAQDYSFNPLRTTILGASKGKELLQQCSRPTPKKVKDFWNISDTDVSNLEKYLKKIIDLNLKESSDYDKIFDSLENYSFQYIGVIIKRKKYIYINVFKSSLEREFPNWKTEPVRACDGYTAFWGVLFDPEKLEFSEMKINGIA